MAFVLVAGATGNTGSLVVKQLLDRGHQVRVVVRDAARLPDSVKGNSKLEVVQASLLDLTDADMAGYVKDCTAVVSCLGHNLTWSGIFGHPRALCTDATRRLSAAVQSHRREQPPTKFIIMSSAGCVNPAAGPAEARGLAERIVLGLLYMLLPPQKDNVDASRVLRDEIGGEDTFVQWAIVRPDDLLDEEVSEYDLYESPLTSPIFNAMVTSRANVAHFMCELIDNAQTWSAWRGKTPVIVNRDQGARSKKSD